MFFLCLRLPPPPSSPVSFSHVARFIGVTWESRDDFYFQVQSTLFFSSYSWCARGNVSLLTRDPYISSPLMPCSLFHVFYLFIYFLILSHYSARTYRVDVDRNVVRRSRSTYIRATIIDRRSTQEERVIETWCFVSFDASVESSLSSWRAENVNSWSRSIE